MRHASALLIVAGSLLEVACQAFLDANANDATPSAAPVDDAGASVDSQPNADVQDGGMSPVTVFVTDELAPENLVTDGKTLIWVNRVDHGTVAACPLTGCGGKAQILASDELYPFSVASFENHLVWSVRDKGALRVRDVAVGTNALLTEGLTAPGSVAVFGGRVFAAVQKDLQGSIISCTSDSCELDTLYSYEPAPIENLAAGPDGLAWLLRGTTLRACLSGACFGVDAISTVVQDPDGIDAFVADRDGYYFWARHGGTRGIYRQRIGEAPSEVVPGASGITSLAVDERWLYFASNSAPGSVTKVSRTGGLPAPLVSPAGNPRSLLLNQNFS